MFKIYGVQNNNIFWPIEFYIFFPPNKCLFNGRFNAGNVIIYNIVYGKG